MPLYSIIFEFQGDFGEVEGDLDDDFVEMAGGALPDGITMAYRNPRREIIDSEDEDEEVYTYVSWILFLEQEDDDERYPQDAYIDEEDESMEEVTAPKRQGGPREIDDAFDKLLEADYNEEQVVSQKYINIFSL